MNYNFDELIDRSSSHCVKIERMPSIWGRADLLPLWVADMDFKSPPCIIEAIQKRLQHEVLGYTSPHEGYFDSIIRWAQKRYGMEVCKEHIQFVTGVIPGIYAAIHALSQKGDKVVIQPPVYHLFKQVIEGSGRLVVHNPLVYTSGRFYMDFAHLRTLLQDCKLFVLCHPHNPGGMAWTQQELEILAQLCAEHHVIVLSDEIHADLTFPPNSHLPFSMVSPTARQISATFMAPSKTFNIPGLAASHIIAYNDELRKKLFRYIRYNDLDMGNVFAYIA
ncbi:MAG: aminotransferase class I/II-fold pyridoxal phosphate-dependent enzyme, partial [Bacteroidales bacterium]|nr:aminotransferase class I/II-fold pyridoxal phosphate-dependent enzyme [Bacteroidales bacterium]